MDPKQLAAQIGTEISAVPDLTAPSNKKFDKVTRRFAELAGLPPEGVRTVWVSKAGNLTVRLNQGGAVGPRPRLAVALLEPSDVGSALRSGRKLAGPGKAVGALALFTKDDAGAWQAVALVEPDGGSIEAPFRAAYPQITIERPAGAATLSDSLVEGLADSLLVDREWMRDVLWMLNDRKSLVLYGPPGTGKTYIAQRIAEALQSDANRRGLVQLHPSYGYEDFFQGYRPVEGKAGIALEKRDGPLRRLAALAAQDPEQPVILVLDEMNRGNLPKVFGELYFLLEYRDRTASLMYSPDEEFTLPDNLFIIGSMNTADRSIAVLDQALRRRFHFAGLFPGEPPVDGMLRRFLGKYRPEMQWVAELLDQANRRLGDRNVAIGPSHFMRKDLDEAVLARVWRYSVLPSIEEQFFGDAGRIKDFQLDALCAALSSTQ
jgi:hypothetical protein